MKRSMMTLVLILACLFSASAPQVARAADTALTGTSWVLSSINGQLPERDVTVTLQFNADGTATGSNGCNRYAMKYTVDGSSISFSPAGATTMMACPPATMRQADAYMQVLLAANQFEVRSSQLTLLDGTRILATFVQARQELAGTNWSATGFNNGRQAVVSPLVGTELVVSFHENNELTGNGGCNDFFATYDASGGTIAIGAIGSTRRVCTTPKGIMDQENEFFAALQSANEQCFSARENTLIQLKLSLHLRQEAFGDANRQQIHHPVSICRRYKMQGSAHGPGTNDLSVGDGLFDQGFGGIEFRAHSQPNRPQRSVEILSLNRAKPRDDIARRFKRRHGNPLVL